MHLRRLRVSMFQMNRGNFQMSMVILCINYMDAARLYDQLVFFFVVLQLCLPPEIFVLI